MSIPILALIAQLCLTPNGNDSWQAMDHVQAKQLACQKYYVQCVKDKGNFKIDSCILEKK